jgi:streptogramin lyase
VLLFLALLAAFAPGSRADTATLSPPPRPLVVGRAWNATLVVRPQPRSRPRVVARPPSGKPVVFGSRRIGRGRYRVRLLLKRPGRWQLSARIGRSSKRLRAVTVVPVPPPTSPLPGATAFRVCGGARQPYLQYGLAVGFGSAWVACRNKSEVQRIDQATGQVVAHIRLPGVSVWSVAAGEGAVWAISLRGSTVYRIDPAANQVVAQIMLTAGVPYIWAGGGAVWASDDDGKAVIRIDPQTNQQVRSYSVGDGPAGFAFDGTFVWILNHRENTLDRIDPTNNTVVRMSTGLAGMDAAAERIEAFGSVLFVTGRGLDLLRVSRTTGSVLGQTEIGAGGIDVVSEGANLWVVPYEAAADLRGEPIADAVLRLDASGAITNRIVPTRQLFANGVAAADGQLWLFDAVAGLLVRLPA